LYLAGSSARKLGSGGGTGKDREGAGLGGSSSDTGQLAEGGTGSEAHYSRKYVQRKRGEKRGRIAGMD